ncbi:MAG: Co(2+)/Mg(2+) efflux protein ApaG [Akkermansiaceae bacterium]
MSEFEHIDGVKVEVDQVVYMPSLHSPMDKPHPFIYYITIYNNSEEVIQILGRKWVVTESDGACVVVEGNGVIGEKPTLNPGEHFSYNSYHVVARSGEACGAYYGVTLSEKGGLSKERFMVEIPEFELRCPG